jgi:hypothetical protein
MRTIQDTNIEDIWKRKKEYVKDKFNDLGINRKTTMKETYLDE